MKPVCTIDGKRVSKLNLTRLRSLSSERLAREALFNHACLSYMLETGAQQIEALGYGCIALKRSAQLAFIAGLFTRLLVERVCLLKRDPRSAPQVGAGGSGEWRALYFAALAEKDPVESMRKIGAVERAITRRLTSAGRSLKIDEMGDLQFALYTLQGLQAHNGARRQGKESVKLMQPRVARAQASIRFNT
jgi:hypothetical protein